MSTTPHVTHAPDAGVVEQAAVEQPADEVVEDSAAESHCCGGSSCATPTNED
jgi:hypothetical protein